MQSAEEVGHVSIIKCHQCAVHQHKMYINVIWQVASYQSRTQCLAKDAIGKELGEP